MDRARHDWVASLLFPGWTQLMYFSFLPAVFFFAWTVMCYVFFGWVAVLMAHLGAGLHAYALVAQHFSGSRPATPESTAKRMGIKWPPEKPVTDLRFHSR